MDVSSTVPISETNQCKISTTEIQFIEKKLETDHHRDQDRFDLGAMVTAPQIIKIWLPKRNYYHQKMGLN